MGEEGTSWGKAGGESGLSLSRGRELLVQLTALVDV